MEARHTLDPACTKEPGPGENMHPSSKTQNCIVQFLLDSKRPHLSLVWGVFVRGVFVRLTNST